MAESKPAVLAETAAPPLLFHAAKRVRANAPLIGLLALGHLVTDVNQGALSAVLPFAKNAHGLSYAQVGTLVLMANVTSSIVQPVFGYFSDRAARRWILPASLVLSGAGIALTGLAAGYESLLAAIILMGLGVAAYHPEGYRTVTGVVGGRKATALSWFSLGGNVGYASGPLLTSSFSVSIVLAQAYLPRRPGMASGLMVGFAMGTGGLAATALGWVADRWGVPVALWISALIPIAAFVGARFLPAPRERSLAIA